MVCSRLKEERNFYLTGNGIHKGPDLLSIRLIKVLHSSQFSRSYYTKMVTLDLNDPKVMTVKKGGTTQVLLFSDALKNSPKSAEWREHKLRFAKTIEAISPITSRS